MSEMSAVIEDLVQRHLLDIAAASTGLRELLEYSTSTALGADTSSDEWLSLERWMHDSLALVFQFAVCWQGLASLLASDQGLRILFGALHIGSLRIARLVLRLLLAAAPLLAAAYPPARRRSSLFCSR